MRLEDVVLKKTHLEKVRQYIREKYNIVPTDKELSIILKSQFEYLEYHIGNGLETTVKLRNLATFKKSPSVMSYMKKCVSRLISKLGIKKDNNINTVKVVRIDSEYSEGSF